MIDNFGYTFEDAHTALGDVRAMAKVFPSMMTMARPIKFPSQLVKLPTYASTGKTLPRNPSV